MAVVKLVAPPVSVRSASDPEPPASSTTGAGQIKSKPVTRAEGNYYIGAFSFLAVCALLGSWFATHWKTGEMGNSFVPIEGISIFGALYVVTLGFERLLEPVAGLYGQTAKPAATADDVEDPSKLPANAFATVGGFVSKADATRERNRALAAAEQALAEAQKGGSSDELERAEKQANLAATWQQLVDQIASNTATLWAIASGLGMLASGGLGLFLLHAIDRGRWDLPRWIDVIATGLVIGGGTKPLHDVITKIQKSKDRDATPAQASNSSSAGTG